MYIRYLAYTEKIEEIVTLYTLMKPIFIWGRRASEIFIAARGLSNRDQWPLLLTWFNFNPSMDK